MKVYAEYGDGSRGGEVRPGGPVGGQGNFYRDTGESSFGPMAIPGRPRARRARRARVVR